MTASAALVTGGAKRLGRVIALHLAARGCDIALHYHASEAEARATQADIRALGRACEIFRADLADAAQIAPLAQAARVAFPHCRYLVNSASIFERGPFLSPSCFEGGGDWAASAAAFDRHFAVNLRAPVLLTQAFTSFSGIRHPASGAERVSIVNLLDSKITALRHPYFHYLLSKKALADFTRMAAAELAPHARVNAVCPGAVMETVDGLHGEEYLEKLAKTLPLKRTATAQEVAEAVHYLLTNDALTGQMLFVDGGGGAS